MSIHSYLINIMKISFKNRAVLKMKVETVMNSVYSVS